jgi:DNA-binding transcriptional MerR regulator
MEKGVDAFRTISEVAGDLDLPQHVLRFWEMRFPQIKPMKRSGGRRFYRPEDVDLLRGIKRLLYGEGYTIKGVQRILKEHGVRFVTASGRGDFVAAAPSSGSERRREPVEIEDDDLVQAPEFAPEQSLGHAGDWAPMPPPPPPPSLKNYSPISASTPGGIGFSGSQTRILRAALSEIVECARLLSAARNS